MCVTMGRAAPQARCDRPHGCEQGAGSAHLPLAAAPAIPPSPGSHCKPRHGGRAAASPTPTNPGPFAACFPATLVK